MKTYNFYVSNVRCGSCKFLVEDILSEVEGVTNVCVDLETKHLSLEAEDMDQNHLLEMLNNKMKDEKHVLSVEKPLE